MRIYMKSSIGKINLMLEIIFYKSCLIIILLKMRHKQQQAFKKAHSLQSSHSQQEFQSENDKKPLKQLPKLLTCFKSKNASPRFKTPQKKRIRTQATVNFDKQVQQRQNSQIRSKVDIQNHINQTLSFISAIKQKKYKLVETNTRLMTEPTFQKPKQRLFSYLERDVITKKAYQVNQSDVNKFYNSTMSKPIKEKVTINSRQFLKNAAFHSFQNFEKIKEKFYEDSKTLIKEQIKIRKKKYASEYRVRRNCPYFSYLSLSKQEKNAVLIKLDKRVSIRDNIPQIQLK